mmetsp:Transcript_8105/g.21357  ORF Transcript_8105/g.21357 Transcript_8105/m.21357 type:complete len:124 (+) Transcript_8105:52-423(+)
MAFHAAFAFLRARAVQAPLTFVGVSACAAWYGVYDLAYLGSATVLRHSSADQPISCRLGGHGCAFGLAAAIIGLRFPQAAISQALSRGQFMQAPWTDATLVLAGSAGLAGVTATVVQRACKGR